MLTTVTKSITPMKDQKNQFYISFILSFLDGILFIIPFIVVFLIISEITELNSIVKIPATSKKIIEYSVIMLTSLLVRILLRYFTLYFRPGTGYKCMCNEGKTLGANLQKISLVFLMKRIWEILFPLLPRM